jgi:hypothetical protein
MSAPAKMDIVGLAVLGFSSRGGGGTKYGFQSSVAVYWRASLFCDVTRPRLAVCYRRSLAAYDPIFKGHAVQDECRE